MKVTAPNTPATQDNAPPPAAGSASTAALIADAKLQVAVSSGTSLVPEPSRDAYEQPHAGERQPTRDGDTQRSSDANPFRSLERDDVRDRDRLATPVDVDVPVDLTPEQHARMSALLAKLAAKNRDLPAKALEGFQLTAHDAQSAGVKLTPNERQALMSHVQKLMSKQVTVEEHRAFWRQMGINSQNVQALVARVLRESYLLSNELMLDMTNRLKKMNALRKEIRDELECARSVKATWSELARDDKTWTAEQPYRAKQVNHDKLEMEADLLDADELASHRERLAARAEGDDASAGAFAGTVEQLNGESRMSAKQKFQLDQLLNGNDDVIKDHMEEIIAALPSMNTGDLRKYIEPFLGQLTHGNTDEDEIKRLFETMSPAQYLTVIADGFTCSSFGFANDDARDFRNLTVARLYDFLGANTPTGENTDKSFFEQMKEVAGNPFGAGVLAVPVNLVAAPVAIIRGIFGGDRFKEAHTNQLTAEGAQQLLAAMEQAAMQRADGAADAAASDGATVGSQRGMSTGAELEDYIKKLEAELNSVGDDAQLMNVDMQSQLQRAQQTMQMLTNLSKVLHDTAMAVIRNTNS